MIQVLHDCIKDRQFPLLDPGALGPNQANLEKKLVNFLDHYLPYVASPFELHLMLLNQRPQANSNENVRAQKKLLVLQVKYLLQLHSVLIKLAMSGINKYIDEQLESE